MNCQEILARWLAEAHAMESAAIRAYENHIEEAAEIPQIEDIFLDFVQKATDKADRLNDRIEELNAESTEIKISLSDIRLPKLLDNKIAGNALLDYSFLHLLIALYKMIEEAARLCDDDEIYDLASELGQVSVEMSDELAEQFKNIADNFINEKAREQNLLRFNE